MLGLAQQIQRDPVGVIVPVGDDQNLGRTRDHVDADTPEDPALGGGDKGIAGAGDLVHRGYGLRAIGQGGNRLRATDAVDRIHPRNARGQQHQRIHHPVGHGAADDQPLYPGHAGGNGVHQYRGRIRRKPPRHIKPRRRNRGPAPAKSRTGGIFPHLIHRPLAVVIGTDAVGGEFQRRAIFGTDRGNGRVGFAFRNGHGFRRQRQAVMAGGQLQHGGVAPAAHIRDDGSSGGIHVFRLFPLHSQQGREGRLETGIAGVQENRHRTLPYCPHPPRLALAKHHPQIPVSSPVLKYPRGSGGGKPPGVTPLQTSTGCPGTFSEGAR